ncbi:tRNA pseudouridine synthase B, putative [Babesia ovis]|uniref:tRNA pseudouridine synthase B, putative n=1 Tax=Babesia ovis TaxID=5869 RepID=A0A9W5T8G4_BABOV|nr:tRNA pseudouridine synthase B, putative [Babesia ovis]
MEIRNRSNRALSKALYNALLTLPISNRKLFVFANYLRKLKEDQDGGAPSADDGNEAEANEGDVNGASDADGVVENTEGSDVDDVDTLKWTPGFMNTVKFLFGHFSRVDENGRPLPEDAPIRWYKLYKNVEITDVGFNYFINGINFLMIVAAVIIILNVFASIEKHKTGGQA